MKTISKAKNGKGAAVAKLSPMQIKAAKLRAAFTPAVLADILAKHPTAELVVGVIKRLTVNKVPQLLKDLERDSAREKDARTGYNTLRALGLKAIDDFRLANGESAHAVFAAELDWRLKKLQAARDDLASIEARIAELQGGLVAPVMKALPAPSIEPAKKPKVEIAKDMTWLSVRRSVLEACAQVAAKEDVRGCLMGVYLHAVKRDLRCTATNGHTLLLHSTPDQPDLPAWLEAGVIVPRAELLIALGVMAKIKDANDEPLERVEIGYATDYSFVTVRDPGEQFATFRLRAIDGSYPDYQKVIESAGQVLAGGERNPLTATTMDGEYMRQAAAIGAKFAAKGITPFFSGDENTPLVISFGGEPGALFIVMPMRSSSELQMPVQTMALIGRGLEGTLAALKATQTRQRKAMGESKSETEKKSMAAVIAARDERIAGVVQAIKGRLLEAPKSA